MRRVDLFQRLDELQRGPLEQLGQLVHAVVGELRIAQRRLSEQAQDLATLQQTVAELTARLDDLSRRVPEPEPKPVAHALLLAAPAGYRIVERPGPPPAPGETVEHGGRRYRILNARLVALPA